MKPLVLLAALVVAGCEACPPSFEAGDIVKHRLTGDRGIVVSGPARVKNVEGMCLVPIRFENTKVGLYSIYEVEPI